MIAEQTTQMINYYEVLEVQPEAPPDEIKRSFRRLAKKYHPDHNNYDEYYEQKLPDGAESWSITRDVSLEFIDYAASGTVDNAAFAGWGDQWVGGTYRETVTGLHRTPVYVQGTFKLNLVTDVAELNPEG